jgi:hypothetical protein
VVEERVELPAALRNRIASDLQPVKSLPPPLRRAANMLPLALMLLVSSVIVFGLRRDAGRIGFSFTWGASIAQMLLGLALVVGALRESVPGTTLPRRIIGAAFGTAAIAVLTATFVTWVRSPTTIAPGYETWVWGICLTGTIVGALPALALAGWLAARAFPLRPRIAGALYGVGAGLLADAGWRLFCHFSSPTHVLTAHTLGVLICGAMGVGLATVVGRRSSVTSR